jgi:GNAT superfamily N-acetyltransferase
MKLLSYPYDDAIRHIARELGHHLALRALLAGEVPGEVYADDPEQPAVVLAWAQQRLFLAGTPRPVDLYAAIGGSIGPRMVARGRPYLALHFAPEAWAGEIETCLVDLAPHAAQRRYFELRAPWPARVGRLPDGLALGLVDRELLRVPGLKNRELLQTEMCSERPSVDDFLAHSFGVCALQGRELAGWCLSEYNHAGACEVGIETLPAFQRRGLGTAMTLALAQQAAQRGLTRVGWHCYAANEASVQTALKAGFQPVADYPAYVLHCAASHEEGKV